MFKNYLKITFRNIIKQKGYAFINIASLAIGMACSMLLIVYIFYELSYDRYHENASRIYRLGRDMTMEGSEIREPLSNCPTAKILLTDYAEVENVARFSHKRRSSVKYGDKLFYENNIWILFFNF